MQFEQIKAWAIISSFTVVRELPPHLLTKPTVLKALAMLTVNLKVTIESFGMHYLFQANECVSTENQSQF